MMYPNRKDKYFIQPGMYRFAPLLGGKVHVWLFWVLAIVMLISSGIICRVLASKIVNTSISLPVPLSKFPMTIGNWEGMERSIPTITREYMEKNFADDYLSRRYVNKDLHIWADVYFVYCSSKPGGMLGHQPLVCYPANGWIHDSTDESSFITKEGRKVKCLIHRFHKSEPSYDETIVLNYYLVNGCLSTDQSGFKGISDRRFNLTRNPARYVAQVQISSIYGVDLLPSRLLILMDGGFFFVNLLCGRTEISITSFMILEMRYQVILIIMIYAKNLRISI